MVCLVLVLLIPSEEIVPDFEIETVVGDASIVMFGDGAVVIEDDDFFDGIAINASGRIGKSALTAILEGLEMLTVIEGDSFADFGAAIGMAVYEIEPVGGFKPVNHVVHIDAREAIEGRDGPAGIVGNDRGLQNLISRFDLGFGYSKRIVALDLGDLEIPGL